MKVCQISLKSLELRPRYGDYSIFQVGGRSFLYVCNLEEKLFSTLILGSVFNDYVVFYEDSVVCVNLCLAVLVQLRLVTGRQKYGVGHAMTASTAQA